MILALGFALLAFFIMGKPVHRMERGTWCAGSSLFHLGNVAEGTMG